MSDYPGIDVGSRPGCRYLDIFIARSNRMVDYKSVQFTVNCDQRSTSSLSVLSSVIFQLGAKTIHTVNHE